MEEIGESILVVSVKTTSESSFDINANNSWTVGRLEKVIALHLEVGKIVFLESFLTTISHRSGEVQN